MRDSAACGLNDVRKNLCQLSIRQKEKVNILFRSVEMKTPYDISWVKIVSLSDVTDILFSATQFSLSVRYRVQNGFP